MAEEFNTIIVVTPSDFERLQKHYDKLIKYLPSKKLIFVGNQEVKKLLDALNLGPKACFMDENDLIPFDCVYSAIKEQMKSFLAGRDLPRKSVGWYYQQFLKMQFAYHCNDEYYMYMEGDTIPCGPFDMFKGNSNTPYIDYKYEYHKEYFDTISILFPGYQKCVKQSFISEHLLFNVDIMKKLIDRIMSNSSLHGQTFYERIINAIPGEKIQDTCFSEFETYGTFVCYNAPSLYKMREWHSFRLGGQFFNPETICERDFNWLYNDFTAISFEKGHSISDDTKNLFDNPKYQAKLSAKQMLQIAQEEFYDGYLEKWDDNMDSTYKSNTNNTDV